MKKKQPPKKSEFPEGTFDTRPEGMDQELFKKLRKMNQQKIKGYLHGGLMANRIMPPLRPKGGFAKRMQEMAAQKVEEKRKDRGIKKFLSKLKKGRDGT